MLQYTLVKSNGKNGSFWSSPNTYWKQTSYENIPIRPSA